MSLSAWLTSSWDSAYPSERNIWSCIGCSVILNYSLRMIFRGGRSFSSLVKIAFYLSLLHSLCKVGVLSVCTSQVSFGSFLSGFTAFSLRCSTIQDGSWLTPQSESICRDQASYQHWVFLGLTLYYLPSCLLPTGHSSHTSLSKRWFLICSYLFLYVIIWSVKKRLELWILLLIKFSVIVWSNGGSQVFKFVNPFKVVMTHFDLLCLLCSICYHIFSFALFDS